MSKEWEVNRRKFIKKSAGTGIGLAVAPSIVASSVFGANERIVMGIIGPGGRGRGLMKIFLRHGAKFAAVCDVYEGNKEEGLKIAGGDATGYIDYRQMLERQDLDAVLIASPEHQHGVQLINTVRSGKDSYCEKPMSHSIEEGVKMIKAVRATDRIVQIGMQRRSTPSVHKAKKVIEDGKLGKVSIVRAQWHWNIAGPLNNDHLAHDLDWERFCHPSKVTEFEPKKFRYWRYFWDFSGGNITDQGTHLMDVIQWFMGSGTPKEAECFGGVYEMRGAETPDVFSAVYDYGEYMATWTLVYTNRYDNGWSIMFQGNQGTMILDGSGFKVYEEPWKPDSKPAVEFQGGLSSEDHVKNFLDCVKSRNESNAPVEVGHKAVCGPHLGNVAYLKKRRAYLSSDATRVWT